jgi:hypothetical protein
MRAAITLAILIGTAGAAWAESNGPVIVIPGRPGVPVIINGVDASYAVVEGDWGLDKGLHFQPTVYGGHPVDPGPPVGHYYPSAGHLPGVGRLEIETADKPKPAPAFHQSWSAGSRQADPLPPVNQVPLNPPPVILAPQFNERDHERGFQQNSAMPPQNPAQGPAQSPLIPPPNPATPQLISPAPLPGAGGPGGQPHRP